MFTSYSSKEKETHSMVEYHPFFDAEDLYREEWILIPKIQTSSIEEFSQLALKEIAKTLNIRFYDEVELEPQDMELLDGSMSHTLNVIIHNTTNYGNVSCFIEYYVG